MDYANDNYFSYSWHQSHDQATVLLMVPYDTKEEDVEVHLNEGYIMAGVRGHPPIVKGRIYGALQVEASSWQLEPRVHASRHRERTTSNTSTTASTQSSFAMISSDPEITSSFAASLEARSGHVSDADDSGLHSPAMSSPTFVSLDVGQIASAFPTTRSRYNSAASSRAVSPGHIIESIASSYSSLEGTPPQSGRLLTLHLEKRQPTIWPSLISGPLSEDVSPCPRHPAVYKTSRQLEHQYNMDATTLTMLGVEHHDIRVKKEDAFEYFIRSWHQQRVPTATIRLVSHYVPLQADLDNLVLSADASHGLPYYVQCLGGLPGVADLYLQAGLLYLEGRASHLLLSPSASLSSLRLPDQSASTLTPGGGTQAFQRDQRMARQFFERARGLQPGLEIPALPYYSAPSDLTMPSLDMSGAMADDDEDETVLAPRPGGGPRRRRRKEEYEVVAVKTPNPPRPETKQTSIKVDNDDGDEDGTWLLYVPGLVGMGTAMLVVGVVATLSFPWGRRNHSS